MSAAAAVDSTMTPGDERAVLKSATVLLLLCMVARHAEFYLFPEGLLQEMGAVQPWIGVWLIPVTTAFGFLMFWGRGFALSISRYDTWRFVAIGSVPLVIALAKGQLMHALSYSYLDPSRRPSFLVLFPVCLAILSTRLNRPMLVALMVACGVLMFWAHNFIAYYLFLFLLFGFSQGLPWFRHVLRSVSSVLLYSGMATAIFLLKIERVNWAMEFLFASAFLGAVFWLTGAFKPLARQVARWPMVSGCGVLYFYVAQGLLFTTFKHFKWTDPPAPIACAVFLLSLWIGWLGKRLDGKAQTWLYRE